MKQYRLSSFSGPDGLRLLDADPPAPGAREVLVKVRASSINARDLMIAAGHFGPAVPAGVVPLSDGAGEVIAVGRHVRRVAVGDRVCATYLDGWISGERTDVGFGRGGDGDGMLSEQVVVDAESLVTIPDHLTFEEAATLPCAGVTAWNALCGYAPLLPGQTVVVQGTGGVSLFALQFATLFGARVIATTSDDAKAGLLRSLGADEIVNYRTHGDWHLEVQRLTSGQGADLVVDIGGAQTLPKSILASRTGGRVSVVGLLTGPPDQGIGAAFFGRFTRFHHIHVGSRDSFEDMNRAISMHALKPVISHAFAFGQVPAAYASLREPGHFGKVVICHG